MSCDHGPEACCNDCRKTTDGRGFPHPAVAKGLVRLQKCPVCRRLTPPERWVHDIARARFGCASCMSPPEAA